MTIADFRRLLAYDDWANRETLASLRAAADPPPKAASLMAHLVAARTVWLDRLEGQVDTVRVWPDWEIDETAQRLDAVSAATTAYFDALDEERFAGSVAYANQHGDRYETSVVDILLQLTTHGPYHRGQIAALLGAAGQPSVMTDFIWAIRLGVPI